MKINFENDLENNLMHMTIKVDKRLFVNEAKVMMNWRRAEELLNKNYSPPSDYKLGECHNKWQKINNDYENLCEQVWTFNLIPTGPAPKATRTKKATTKPKTAKK